MISLELSIQTVSTDGAVELSLAGVLDSSTGPRLREELQKLADNGARQVVIDLAELYFLDSAGLGVLVAALKRFRCAGGSLDLRRPKGHVSRVLDVTGVSDIFNIREDPQLAPGST